MTDEDQKKLDELMQLAQVSMDPDTVTPGYGLFPVGALSQSELVEPIIPEPVQ